MAYSMDLKLAAINAYISGDLSIEKVASLFNVGTRTLKTWLFRYRQGELEPRPIPGRPSRLDSEQKKFVVNCLLEEPDITLLGLCDKVSDEFGIEFCESAMWRIITSEGFRRKKKSYLPLEALRSDVKKKKRLL